MAPHPMAPRTEADTARPEHASEGDQSVTVDGPADPEDFLTCALLLDPRKCIKGCKLSWSPGPRDDAPIASHRLRALLSCAAAHLHPPRLGWRLGRLVLLFDMSPEGLGLEELHALPPANVVLCMGRDDLMDARSRPMLLMLHRRGIGFMLRGSAELPDDPELCGILSHVDVGNGHPDSVAGLLRGASLVLPTARPVATDILSALELDACAARQLDVLIENAADLPAAHAARSVLLPETMVIVRTMQLIRRNDDLRSIEATLMQDGGLSERLLRHINSPGVGVGVPIRSLRQALAIFGYAPLFRWMSVLLAASNQAAADFMVKKAIVRGRFVELMGQGIAPPHEADHLFLAGVFSLMDRLLGVSVGDVLDHVELPEPVRIAVLSRGGLHGRLVALAESCETGGREAAALSDSVSMSANKVNAAHLAALAWAQDVAFV